MERKLYRVTGPDGRQYIGWTGMKVQIHWADWYEGSRTVA